MITALKTAGRELTEVKLVHSLETLDMDFRTFGIHFHPNSRQGNHQVFLTKIEHGRAVPIQKLNPADYAR
jgi:hypothetical protein